MGLRLTLSTCGKRLLYSLDYVPPVGAILLVVVGDADLAYLEGEADIAEGGNHAIAGGLARRLVGSDARVRHAVDARGLVVGVLGHQLIVVFAFLCPVQDLVGQRLGLILCARLGLDGRAAAEAYSVLEADQNVLDGDMLR